MGHPANDHTKQDQSSDKDKKDENNDKNTPPAESGGGKGGQGGGKDKGERRWTSKPDKPIKGAKPIRDKTGKITGWLIPSPDGKGVKKTLEWGKANGLNPADFKKVAVGVGVVGVAGLIHTIIATAPEWGPWLAGALAF